MCLQVEMMFVDRINLTQKKAERVFGFLLVCETTHAIFEQLDFISKLVSLVPKPKVNLTWFHGVFAVCRNIQTASTEPW
ncbi:MAG: hypothetical protein ACI9YO_003009 [Gammaproteobacteria bacterium]|jgi:hypothetical protein